MLGCQSILEYPVTEDFDIHKNFSWMVTYSKTQAEYSKIINKENFQESRAHLEQLFHGDQNSPSVSIS